MEKKIVGLDLNRPGTRMLGLVLLFILLVAMASCVGSMIVLSY